MSDPVVRLNAALEGRYKIEGELGAGGMATVYLAEDLKHVHEDGGFRVRGHLDTSPFLRLAHHTDRCVCLLRPAITELAEHVVAPAVANAAGGEPTCVKPAGAH